VNAEAACPAKASRHYPGQTIRAGGYLVTWGLGESERSCRTFGEALACYIDHQHERGGARVFNVDHCYDDGERCSDGLTDEEREAVELADELHTTELVVR
jgi:hypothetical protein